MQKRIVTPGQQAKDRQELQCALLRRVRGGDSEIGSGGGGNPPATDPPAR